MDEKDNKLKFGANSTDAFVEEKGENSTFWGRISKAFKSDDSTEFTALPENTTVNPSDIKPMQPSESKTAIPLSSPFASSFNTITRDTTITGDFVTESELKFNGTLKGELKSTHNVTIGGNIQGNITGKDIQITSGAVKGNIESKGNLSLDGKSVVIGDINAISCAIDGRVKGSIVAEGTVSLQNNSIIHGNITANHFDAQKGAVLKGNISIICNDKRSEAETFALPESKVPETPVQNNQNTQNDQNQPINQNTQNNQNAQNSQKSNQKNQRNNQKSNYRSK